MTSSSARSSAACSVRPAPSKASIRYAPAGEGTEVTWTMEGDLASMMPPVLRGLMRPVMGVMIGKTAKQCRERWHNHLEPGISKSPWTTAEELALFETHQRIGNKWAEIAKILEGRTDNMINTGGITGRPLRLLRQIALSGGDWRANKNGDG